MSRKCRQVNLSVMRYHDVAFFQLVQWDIVEINSSDDTRTIALEMLPQDARLSLCQHGLERAGGTDEPFLHQSHRARSTSTL